MAKILTLDAMQVTNADKYRRTIAARGKDANFIRFVEEVGELAKALRRNAHPVGDSNPELRGEFADVLAWLLTLAAIHRVSLEGAYMEKYGSDTCFRCGNTLCCCAEAGNAPTH